MPEISQADLDALNEKVVSIDALTKKFEEGSNTLKRIEGENTKMKSRAQEAEDKLKDFAKEKLENNGELQKRLDMEIDENTKLKADNAIKSEKALTAKIKAGITEQFPNLQKGAVDLMLQIGEHKSLLKIDKEAETVDGIKEFGEAVQKTHGYFWTKTKLKDTDNLPPGNKDLDKEDLTGDELYKKELSAAKTQDEFDAVRRKHGRLS